MAEVIVQDSETGKSVSVVIISDQADQLPHAIAAAKKALSSPSVEKSEAEHDAEENGDSQDEQSLPLDEEPMEYTTLNTRQEFTPVPKQRPDAKSFKCSLCEKGFGYRIQLKRHEMVDHGLNNSHNDSEDIHQSMLYDPNTSSDLGDNFKYRNKHQSVVDRETKKLALSSWTPEKGAYSCKLCSSKIIFYNNKDLAKHMMEKHDVRPFACAECGAEFGRKNHMKRHLKNIHAMTKEEVNDLFPAQPPAENVHRLHSLIRQRKDAGFDRFRNPVKPKVDMPKSPRGRPRKGEPAKISLKLPTKRKAKDSPKKAAMSPTRKSPRAAKPSRKLKDSSFVKVEDNEIKEEVKEEIPEINKDELTDELRELWENLTEVN